MIKPFNRTCRFLNFILMHSIVFTLSTACGTRLASPPSRLAITDGAPTEFADYQSVVKILRYESELSPVLCTGTFITQRRILTAAHCLGDQQEVAFEITGVDTLGQSQTQRTTSFAVHPSYTDGGAIQPHDIAILELNGDWGIPASLPETFFPKDLKAQPATIVGYGNTQNTLIGQVPGGSGSGTKRTGHNHVYAATNRGFIILSGGSGCETGTSESTTGDGDSGGPIFIDGKLAGITLGGGLLPPNPGENCPKAISYFASTGIDSNLSFIQQFLY